MIKIAQSFGGFGTTIQVPRKMMTFSEINEELDKKGINNNFIRISVGLENIKDIILDLETSLKKIKK
jgi:cystathionine beta-lyase/cystathionine gamma-synthase